MPLEVTKRLDHLAANARRSKNVNLLELLGPMLARLRKRASQWAVAGE